MGKFEAEKNKRRYAIKIKSDTLLQKAKKLDRKAIRPAYIFPYIVGVIGFLVLGVGMCLGMKVIGEGTRVFIVEIIIGLIGVAMVSVNYPIFKKILKAGKENKLVRF